MADDLPTLQELTSEIDAQSLEPDVAANAIRSWRNEARPQIAGSLDNHQDRWMAVDELDNQVDEAMSAQRKKAVGVWATNRFQDPAELTDFQTAYDQARGDSSKLDGRFAGLAEELNNIATHPAFQSTREARDMTGKITVGDTTLARYSTRIAGDKAEVMMAPDAQDSKPISFDVLMPTVEDVTKAKSEAQSRIDRIDTITSEASQNPDNFVPTGELDAEAADLRKRVKQLDGPAGKMLLLNERIHEKVRTPEFQTIGDSTWGAAGVDVLKGLQNASFNAAGLVSRAMPRTMEHVLEGVGSLPDTGSSPTEPDRALKYFSEAKAAQDAAYPGSTRATLEGGFWNSTMRGSRIALGEMLPYLAGGQIAKIAGGAEGKAAAEAMKAAGVVPMGATGVGMGAGMTGGSYLETIRRIDDAERAGDTETVDRLKRGMDAHAILSGVLGASMSKMSPLHNLELSGSGVGSMAFDMLKQGAEMPLMGIIQRGVIDPATLGDRPDVFEPIAQEFGVGVATAFPLAIGSKIIEKLGAKKAAIAIETTKAKELALATGADDQATLDALQQVHDVKIAAANGEAVDEAKPVASKIKEIDDKLIEIEKDPSLDDNAKKDAREPLIKAKLDIYFPEGENSGKVPETKPVVESAPINEAPRTTENQPAAQDQAPVVSDNTRAEKPQTSRNDGGDWLPKSPMGGGDILDFVNSMQIGPPRSSSGDLHGDMDWKEQRSVPPYYQHRLFTKSSLNGINEVAQAAYDRGLISDYKPDTLMNKIFEAIKARKDFRESKLSEQRAMDDGERKLIDFSNQQNTLEAKPSATEVRTGDLAHGDKVVVDGTEMKVTKVHYDGEDNQTGVTLLSDRFGEINLSNEHQPSIMADRPAEKAPINTDFLPPEDAATSDQAASSDQSTRQSQPEAPLQGEQGSADTQQAPGSNSSADVTTPTSDSASTESQDPMAIKNAAIDDWREKNGLPPFAKAVKKSWGPLMDKAASDMEKDPGIAEAKVKYMLDHPSDRADEDVPYIALHIAQHEKVMKEADAVITSADPGSKEFREAKDRRADALGKIAEAQLALRLSARESARSLNIQKLLVDRSEVPDIASMTAERMADLNRNLSREEKAEVESVQKEMADAKPDYDKAKDEIETSQLQAENAATVDKIADEILQLSSTPEGRRKIGQKARDKLALRAHEAMKLLREKKIIGGGTANAMGLGGEFDADAMKAMVDVATYYLVEAGGIVADAVARFARELPHVAKETVRAIFDDAQKANTRLEAKLEEISKQNIAKDKRKSPSQIVDKAKLLLESGEDVDPAIVRALHRAYIEEGVRTEKELTSKVAGSLGEIYGRKFTDDDVRRIHTQYGKVAKLPSDEVSMVQRDIKRQQLLLTKIEALKNGEPLLATGVEREKNSLKVHALQQELETIKKETNYRKAGKGQLSGLQDRIAARLDTLIADTIDQIVGNKPVRAGRSTTEYDADNIERVKKLKALRKELRQRRPNEIGDVADKAAIEAAKASKEEYERKLAEREWEATQEPTRKPSKELVAARLERDQAATDYREAERNSQEWKARDHAKRLVAAEAELDALEVKLREHDTSKESKKPDTRMTSDELKAMQDRKAEIKKELNDMRSREPMTPEEERIYLEEKLKAAEETKASLLDELSTGVRKTIFRRDRPKSEALDKVQAEIKDLRKRVAEMRYGDGQAAFDKWAKERIDTLNKQLSEGREPGSKRSYPDTPANRAKLAEIKSLEDQMKAKEAPAKRLKTIRDRIEQKKKEIAKLTSEGWRAKPDSSSVPESPEIEQAKSDLDKLQKIEEEWHANDGERDNAAYRKRLDAAEKVMADRIARGDYKPKPKKEIKLTKETADRLLRFREAQKHYYEMKLNDRLKNMSLGGKILDATGQSLAVARGLLVGGEFSMAGRQGFLPATLAPTKVPKALLEMMKSFLSERWVTEAETNLKGRENFARYERDKLFLSDVKDWTENKVEEANTGRWVRKIPVLKNFERGNSTILNILRANAYDAIHANHIWMYGVEPTPEEGRAYATQVNIMSGRGEFGKFEMARPAASKIMFSPGQTISRFQYAGGGALWTGTAKSKAVLAAAYGKTIAVTATMLALAWYASGSDKPVELDPRSADFLKIKIGKTRVDLLAGMAQAIVFMSRMATRQDKRNGKITPLAGPSVKYGEKDLGTVISSFSRSKLNPFLGAAFNAALEKDYAGNKSDVVTELDKMWKPMTWADIADVVQEQGVTKSAALIVAAMLGAGVATYDNSKKPSKKTKVDDPFRSLR